MSGFIAGKYQSSPTAYPSGSDVQVAVDTYGNVQTKLVDGSTGTAVSYGFTPSTELATSAGLLVKTGAGLIGDIQCNATGSGNTLIVYDGTSASGTVLANIVSATVGQKFCELWKFSVGLYIAQSGGTPGKFTASTQ